MEMLTAEVRLKEAVSTMEEAKLLVADQDFLLVTAETQTGGKGTRGRVWQSLPGNIYMTIGIHRRHLPAERLALLPLEIGLLLWKEVATRIPAQNRPFLQLKWPNDLMYRNAKTAGILMESYGNFFLIGIGINVAGAPAITDGGSQSICLSEAGMAHKDNQALIDGLYARIKAPSEQGIALVSGLNYSAEDILLDWQGKVNWNRMHRLRDREGQPWVKPRSVNNHGHLQVLHQDGNLEWLVADYLV
jgi:BirA family transcriptional regulator, biotin operon repressor / biotin---[acetyl-CoA-carboxylase] ligase